MRLSEFINMDYKQLIHVLQNESLDSYSGTVGLNCYIYNVYKCPGSPGDTGLVLNLEPMQLRPIGLFY